MLTTFRIGPTIGRVCYVTESGAIEFVTVECPNERLAVRFESDRPLKIGDWVRLYGEARIDASVRSDGSEAEPSSYYHVPHDGTDKTTWVFKQMTSAATILTAPPKFSEQMHEAMLCLRRHLDSWEKNLDVQTWEETLGVLNKVLALVKEQVDERKPMPIAAVQITDL